MTWRRWLFDNFLTHAVPSELEVPLLADLEARGAVLMVHHGIDCELTNPKTIASWHLDLGGSMYMGRPEETFPWCGLEMSVPSEHVGRVARILSELPGRRFDNGDRYCKLKLWRFALVMTPEQHRELAAIVGLLVGPAEDHAAAFAAAVERAAVHGVS